MSRKYSPPGCAPAETPRSQVATGKVSDFVRGAIERMQKSRPLFSEVERKVLADYDGPIVSGDPDGPRSRPSIKYDDQEDVLFIQFSKDPIVKDVSHGWNVHIGYAANGITEITIIDAKASGYWPLSRARLAELVSKGK